MTDGRDYVTRAGVYDDDRLLACALGLEEDPELLAAAAADPELGARLEAARADVARIGAGVAAAVPGPEDSYTDLSDDRWAGLAGFFEPPAVAARSRRRRRWWRVAAPVAALLVLAFVVGIAALNGGGVTGSGGTSSEVAQSGAEGVVPGPGFGDDTTGSGSRATTAPSIGERFSDEVQRFAVVVLARARQVTGAVQRFAVLRIFKGEAPKVVELVVNDQPADSGRLHLLLLEPTAPPVSETGSPWPLTESPEAAIGSPLPATVSPEPLIGSPAPVASPTAADGGPGEPLAVSYTYHGEPVMVREFAAGTDPASVTVTIP
jgi:hypothetical protein